MDSPLSIPFYYPFHDYETIHSIKNFPAKRSNILEKTDCHNTAQLVMFAVKKGLI